MTMPADAAEIVRLAERVEQATGPDRELDGAIDRLFNARPKDGDYDEGEGAFWRVKNGWSGLLARPDGFARGSFSAANYTASLDAAMTLVPEGWRWTAGHREFPHARGYVENGELAFVGVGTRRNPNRMWFETTAATPALALTAAALRARAAQHDHEVG